MRVARIKIANFRGIASGELCLAPNVVLVGDNNSGKSTLLEAIDLVLGPERLARPAPIDEHDFYGGRYLESNGQCTEITIEVVVVDLNEEQVRHFKDHIEWWETTNQSLIEGPPAEATDDQDVLPALRVGFTGKYDPDEDDFVGATYFLSPPLDSGGYTPFRTTDKRLCGFLFLRTLRTGSRALSLERGSLLDIILRLQDKRLQMWEDVLGQLRVLPVADNPELGISTTLSVVQDKVRSFVPSDWADNPHMRVSDLTRDGLRRILTVFMSTGATTADGADHAAPFQHQGTGTINTLVLALLSLIAELKQNVIFAMEEPEIAIPPHTQKRIIDSVRRHSAQALFTSHSPYVLEEFDPSEILVVRRLNGALTATPAAFPAHIKAKAYRHQFRMRFCEALLARRILIVEGHTEYDALPAAARRLHQLRPDKYSTLEALGIAVINAESESQVASLGEHFGKLGHIVFATFDKQSPETKAAIDAAVAHSYEAPEKGFENVLLNGTAEPALRRFAADLVADGEWPRHLASQTPTATTAIGPLKEALREYLRWSKGAAGSAAFLCQCEEQEMPDYIVQTLLAIKAVLVPPIQSVEPASSTDVPQRSEADA